MSSPTRVSPASFLKLSGDVASFYGFRPMRELERIVSSSGARGPVRAGRAHTFTTVATLCSATVRPGEPVLAYYASASPAYLPLSAGKNEVGEFGMQVVGSEESLGEILLLKTITTIIEEWGIPLARVRINALGDKDSKLRFGRELVGYLRKHQDELCPDCRQKMATDLLAPYQCTTEQCREVLAGGPRAMNFLSEKSRLHFREVLEHVEGLGLPYELDDLLVGDERESHTIFAVDLGQEDATIVAGMGGRFDEHVQRITGSKVGAVVSASVFFRKKGLSATSFHLGASTQPPKIYFVQLGLRAKLQGLSVLDALRRAHLPVLQSFDSSKLSPQLLAAQGAGVKHLLIMGQREALDGTVLVRSTQNSSQQIIQLAQLPRFLKTLR